MDLCDGGAGKYKSERYRAWCREKGLPVPDDVPARSRRSRFGFENVLRDPATDAESIRYWRFTSSLVCDTIREFADRVRKRCGREIELGVFYGYILELGGDWVKKGHLAYQELLASGSIDFLISPGTYEHRKIGDGGGFMVPMGTVRRFGRNYLHECDQRTHCFNPNLSRAVRLEFQHWQDEAEDIAGMRREMALSLIPHTSLWWFDMWGGYYQSPAVFDNLARMKELWDRYSGDDSPGAPRSPWWSIPTGPRWSTMKRRGRTVSTATSAICSTGSARRSRQSASTTCLNQARRKNTNFWYSPPSSN